MNDPDPDPAKLNLLTVEQFYTVLCQLLRRGQLRNADVIWNVYPNLDVHQAVRMTSVRLRGDHLRDPKKTVPTYLALNYTVSAVELCAYNVRNHFHGSDGDRFLSNLITVSDLGLIEPKDMMGTCTQATRIALDPGDYDAQTKLGYTMLFSFLKLMEHDKLF